MNLKDAPDVETTGTGKKEDPLSIIRSGTASLLGGRPEWHQARGLKPIPEQIGLTEFRERPRKPRRVMPYSAHSFCRLGKPLQKRDSATHLTDAGFCAIIIAYDYH